jgi:hypothetical protein
MARIPTLDGPQVAQRGLGAPTVGGQGPDNSGLQRGLAQVGQAAQQFAMREKEKADTAALMTADQQLDQWQQNAFFDPQNGVYAKKGGAALDITNQTIGQFEQQQAKIGESLKNERQRARYNELVMRRRQSLSNDLNHYEYREREQYYDDVDRGQIETSMQGAALNYNDPEKIAYYQNKMAAVLQSQAERKGLPAEMQQANLLKANSGMASAVISRMANDDPYKAKTYFETAQEQMTADDQVQISRLIDREIKAREIEARQMQAIARAELSSRVSDAQSAYLSGYEFENPPSRDDFTASYGAEEGSERYAQFVKTQDIGTAIRQVAMASPEERAKLINDFMPARDGVAKEGFAVDAKLYGQLVNTASRLGEELQNDPATYVASRSPLLRKAAEDAASGDPAAVEAYATAMIAEQQRLGAPEPKLLSSKQAAGIADAFQSTADGGNNSAQLIDELQQQWGKYWPTVFKQMKDKLPGAALVIGTGVDPQTSAMLARIAPLKTEELKKGLLSTDTKDAKDTLNDEMADFRLTLAGQVGGERTFATLYGEAERLAYAYMAQGKSPKDAVSQVTKSLVDDKYTLQGTYRVPKSFDADIVEAGTERAIETLDPSSLRFAVPKGIDEAFAKERVKAAISKDGYWVTLPDESGLALYYGGEAVLTKDGEPVMRSFDDLSTEAVNNPSVWTRFNEGRKKMNNANTPAWGN